MPFRVLLADDHTLVRAGLRALLEAIPGVVVVAETGSGREALELVDRHKPELLMLDISMPELSGIEVADRVAKSFPEIRVMMLSMHRSEMYVIQALRAGASGYLLKDAATTELPAAIEAMRRGETYLSPGISQHVIELVKRGGQAETNPLETLTPRQREILQSIAEGLSTKEIAVRLHVSAKTVETHRSQLMDRLGIHDVPGLVRLAIRTGLISADH